jgi:SH3-like domain-containing protein
MFSPRRRSAGGVSTKGDPKTMWKERERAMISGYTGRRGSRARRWAVLGGLVLFLLGLGPLLTDVVKPNSAATAQPATHAAGSAMPATVPGATGLPVPRFVSLKSDQVNVRRGPAADHQIAWIFQRAGLPVEVTAEWENWRRIRDADGSEGWIYHSLLSGRRTAVVAPWAAADKTFPLRSRADADATLVARMQPGVLSNVASCNGSWCRIRGDGYDGYIEQDRLWGVYPGEKFD